MTLARCVAVAALLLAMAGCDGQPDEAGANVATTGPDGQPLTDGAGETLRQSLEAEIGGLRVGLASVRADDDGGRLEASLTLYDADGEVEGFASPTATAGDTVEFAGHALYVVEVSDAGSGEDVEGAGHGFIRLLPLDAPEAAD